uniref:RING-type domain-containing protein n=1 Tax=Plectus sambesii TaxID=2011161 RepID=A0A914V7K5_9BILA
MKILFIPYCFFPLLFFFGFVPIAAIAVDPGDYVFVDPKSSKIKVKDLRALLDKRGLPYHDFHEKSEYVNALVESGPLTVGELKIARDSTSESISSDDIEELVTDLIAKTFEETVLTSSKIWLVRIDPESNSTTNTLDEAVWRRLITTLNTFEVEFGQLNCTTAAVYCQTKGWNSPTLILVIPRLHNSAEHSKNAEAYLLQTSINSLNQKVYEADSVLRQIYSQLHGKHVRYLPSRENFENLQTDGLKCSVQIVLLTDLRQCPFLLSALAANFNYDPWCFALGPKTIVSGTLVLPDNHVGAFYAIKSQHYYSNRWRIIPQNQSKPDANDDTSNAMVTFDSLSDLLMQLSLMKAKKLEAERKWQPKKVNKPYTHTYTDSPPPTNSNSKKRSEHEFSSVFWYNVIVLLLVTIGIPGIGIYVLHRGNTERRRTEELTRYRSNISSRNQSGRQNISRNVWEEEEDNQNERSYRPSSTILHSYDLNPNQEMCLLSIEDYLTIMTLRVTNMTDWHKKAFIRYSLHRAVSRDLQMLLPHYRISIEEIGFPPYNWIMRLPVVETGYFSADIRQSECLICQCSIDNPEDRLCRLPCNCRDVIYHFDCIVPWLIKREDPNSHSFLSGRLHTERPCPTCRFDITNWGLQ